MNNDEDEPERLAMHGVTLTRRQFWTLIREVSSQIPPDRFATDASQLVRLPRGFVTALAEAHLDVTALATRCELDPKRLSVPEPSLHRTELARLFEVVFSPPAPASIGLAIGKRIRIELFGVLGFATLSAPTYRAAVERCARYKRLVTDMRVEIQPGANQVGVRIEVAGDGPAAHGRVDVELAFLIAFGRRQALQAPRVYQLQLRRPNPGASEAELYRSYFGCPVRFAQPANEIVLARASLDAPLLTADPDADRLLAGAVDQQLAAQDSDICARARAAIEQALPDGAPDLPTIATRLRTSSRSLQRRLRHRGTSYRDLLEDTRRTLAFRLLEEGRFEIAEVSFVLGFTNLSSFYRAFKRWSGDSPAAYAARARANRRAHQ